MAVKLKKFNYDCGQGLCVELLMYILQFLTLPKINELRVVSRTWFVVCTTPYLRRKLYRKAVDAFENRFGVKATLPFSGKLRLQWLPLYMAAREASLDFAKAPNRSALWGVFEWSIEKGAPFCPAMIDPQPLYDGGKWSQLRMWGLRVRFLRHFFRNAKKELKQILEEREKPWKKKKNTRCSLPKTIARIKKETSVLYAPVLRARRLLKIVDDDLAQVTAWWSNAPSMFNRLPQGFVDDQEGFEVEAHGAFLRAVDDQASFNRDNICRNDPAKLRNHARCVWDVMEGKREELFLMITHNSTANNNAICDIAAWLDDPSVFRRIPTNENRFNSFRDPLARACDAFGATNLAEWLLGIGVCTRTAIADMDVDQIDALYVSRESSRGALVAGLVKWDRPDAFQALFDAHKSFRHKVTTEWTWAYTDRVCKFALWDPMPCSFAVLQSMRIPRSDVGGEQWRAAMQGAMEIAGKTWDDVFNHARKEGKESWRLHRVFALASDHLSPEAVKKFCLVLLNKGKTEAIRAVEILVRSKTIDIPELLASSKTRGTGLFAAVDAVDPWHRDRMMTIAIEKRNVRCISVLLKLSFTPTEAHLAAIAKLKGKGAKPVQNAVKKNAARFLVKKPLLSSLSNVQ
jgi:hypothetical protein